MGAKANKSQEADKDMVRKNYTPPTLPGESPGRAQPFTGRSAQPFMNRPTGELRGEHESSQMEQYLQERGWLRLKCGCWVNPRTMNRYRTEEAYAMAVQREETEESQ